jgi:dCMP deaminase
MTGSELRWARHFFDIANVIKTKSKDPNTQVACIIVGPDNEVRSTGYNSLPRGLNDNIAERLERPEKYLWIEHAERNAIYNAARAGICTKGCTIYMQGLPCMDCARAIIQSGIIKLVYDKVAWDAWYNNYNGNPSKWVVETQKSLIMLWEAQVEVVGI